MSANADLNAAVTPVINATPDPQVAYLMQRDATCNAVANAVVVTLVLAAIALWIGLLVGRKGGGK